jgi:hypothetical protein
VAFFQPLYLRKLYAGIYFFLILKATWAAHRDLHDLSVCAVRTRPDSGRLWDDSRGSVPGTNGNFVTVTNVATRTAEHKRVDSSEIAAQQSKKRCTVYLQPRAKGV